MTSETDTNYYIVQSSNGQGKQELKMQLAHKSA